MMRIRKVSVLFFLTFCLLIEVKVDAQYTENGQEKKLEYTSRNTYETVQVRPVKGKKVKNVILMIGDGMGLNQVSTAWVANHGRLNLDNFTHTGMARTYAADRLITDSGAAGTAMATGKKAMYHSIAVDAEGNPLSSITDLAHDMGLSTAVVVTCGLTDATPAAFCSNSIDRNQLENIAVDYLNCNVDFLFGGGRSDFTRRADGRNLMDEMKETGYQVTTTWQDTKKIKSGKVFAVIDDGQLPMAPDRGTIWQEAVMQAIKQISKNKKGFFAMFEGSRVDDCGHNNSIPALVEEIFDFDQTIGKVLQWAEKNGETLVVVLADHETGGLTLLDGDIQKGWVKGHYSTQGHSGIIVPVFAYGPGSEIFTGVYENTDVFSKIIELLKIR